LSPSPDPPSKGEIADTSFAEATEGTARRVKEEGDIYDPMTKVPRHHDDQIGNLILGSTSRQVSNRMTG